MKLSVIIVSYNVRHYLMQCLDSVQRATQGMEAEVWVVDNASTDDSVAAVRDAFPTVHVIAGTDNVGFARANNIAIRQATGQYILLLNPDTIVGEDVLEGCTRFLDSHPEAGATGVCMTNRDGTFAPESRRGLPTPATALYKMCGLARLFPRSHRFGRYHMMYLDRSKPARIDVISGAFMMMRRRALDEAGLLDEDYFMYGEDIDLSYRILKAGWQNWYIPLRILHYKGESTQKTTYRYVHNFYNAMLIFFRKHFARGHRLTTFLVWPVVTLMATIEMFVRKASATLHTLRPQPTETILFLGSQQSWPDVNAIATRFGIKATTPLPSAPASIPSPSGTQAPTSTSGIQVPSSTSGTQATTSTSGIQVSSSTSGTQATTSTSGIQVPSSTSGTQAPTSTSGIQVPSSTTPSDVRGFGMSPYHGDPNPTYLVFEAGHTPYTKMLSLLAQQAEAGHTSQIGIYSPTDNTIILPNDILI